MSTYLCPPVLPHTLSCFPVTAAAALLPLLLRETPAFASALWPGTKDKEGLASLAFTLATADYSCAR